MKREQQKIFDHLFLSALYKRPPPLWHHPAFLHFFGDAYLSNTALEGGELTVRAFLTTALHCAKRGALFEMSQGFILIAAADGSRV